MPAPRFLPETYTDRIKRRLAGWINTHHGGNLAAAAEALGCTYTQLYWPLKRGGPITRRLLAHLKHAKVL